MLNNSIDCHDLNPVLLESAPRVGGHAGLSRCVTSGRIYKPILDWRGECERAFYELVAKTQDADGILSPACFIPRFYGVWHRTNEDDDDNNKTSWLVLNDVTAGSTLPCVMDIKLGSQTFAPDAGIVKAARELAKSDTAVALGFRVTGFSLAEGTSRGRAERSAVTVAAAHEPFAAFFNHSPHHPPVSTKALSALLIRLESMKSWAEKNSSDFLFFGTSLLLFYDAAAAPNDGIISATLIDFAHVWNRTGRLSQNCSSSSSSSSKNGKRDDDDHDDQRRLAVSLDFTRGLSNVIACVERVRNILIEKESHHHQDVLASLTTRVLEERTTPFEQWLDE